MGPMVPVKVELEELDFWSSLLNPFFLEEPFKEAGGQAKSTKFPVGTRPLGVPAKLNLWLGVMNPLVL